jgi:hypothetical protein
MDRRDELLRREAEGWDALTNALRELDPDRLRADPNAEGWSISDLLWHVGAWCEEAARVLGEIEAGTWPGEEPALDAGRVDRFNEEQLRRSRGMDVARAERACREGRRRMLEAFGVVGEPTPEAEEWFVESGPAHYAEHLVDLRRWAEAPPES